MYEETSTKDGAGGNWLEKETNIFPEMESPHMNIPEQGEKEGDKGASNSKGSTQADYGFGPPSTDKKKKED